MGRERAPAATAGHGATGAAGPAIRASCSGFFSDLPAASAGDDGFGTRAAAGAGGLDADADGEGGAEGAGEVLLDGDDLGEARFDSVTPCAASVCSIAFRSRSTILAA